MPTSNSIGNRIINTVSGENAAMQITHSSNTASSNALLDLQVAGSSAGDSYIYMTNGTTNYCIGLDNSDSDAYCLAGGTSLNGSNFYRIGTDGNLTTPQTSAFFAYMPDTANVTGAGTTYTLAGYTEVFDTRGDFNPTTGIFTAGRAGVYLFTGCISVTQITTAMTSGLMFLWAAGVDNRFWAGSPTAWDTAGNSIGANFAIMVNLAAAQTAELRFSISNGAGDTADLLGLTGSTYRTWFSGCLIA